MAIHMQHTQLATTSRPASRSSQCLVGCGPHRLTQMPVACGMRLSIVPTPTFANMGGAARRASRQTLHVCMAAAPWKPRNCRIALEDGSIWKGSSFGAEGTQVGECVFNTSITGYQEIMTDPSYKGQFVVFTHPHIGNVGINEGVWFGGGCCGGTTAAPPWQTLIREWLCSTHC